MGVIGPVARGYFKIKSMKKKQTEVEPHVAAAVEQIRNSPAYLQTRDAEEALARDATGDNIVVIAQGVTWR